MSVQVVVAKSAAVRAAIKARQLDRVIQLIHNTTHLGFGLNSLDSKYDVDRIGVDGAKLLAQALAQNTSLVALGLDYNGIGDDGAKALADALHVNTSLQKLLIRYNGIRLAGVAAVSEAMRWNASITWMYLYEDESSSQWEQHNQQIRQYEQVGADGIYVD
jgi:hypothetical protein